MSAVAILRLLAGIGGVVAIVATLLDTASRATINPFNFFGYFTMQSNIIFCVTMLVAAGVARSGRPQSAALVLVRGCATAYIFLVGAIYNTLLAGLPGGVALPWANTVLHTVLPLYGVLDWLLFADRPPLPWNRLWVALIYPVVWMVVVLIRGATDGWVPYPFFDPATGYGSVAGYCLAIAALTIAAAAGVWAVSRLTIINPAGSAHAPV